MKCNDKSVIVLITQGSYNCRVGFDKQLLEMGGLVDMIRFNNLIISLSITSFTSKYCYYFFN